MVKLKDIAARAGVSVMTVSKALRESKDISAGTRTRIRKLALEMGYLPDLSAQLMRSGRTKLFGLIISAATNPIYARIVMAIEERAHEIGYDLLFAHSLNQPSREEACIRSRGCFARPGELDRLKERALGTAGTPICAQRSS